MPRKCLESESWCCRDQGARSKHKYKRGSPYDISVCFMKLCGDVADSQGHCEEVEGIPRPRKECNLEKCQTLSMNYDGGKLNMKHARKNIHCF